jgi:hypothetical protein
MATRHQCTYGLMTECLQNLGGGRGCAMGVLAVPQTVDHADERAIPEHFHHTAIAGFILARQRGVCDPYVDDPPCHRFFFSSVTVVPFAVDTISK